ncbi:MAG: hypothetical protein AAGF47_08040 [Planctomycetota bacterium]
MTSISIDDYTDHALPLQRLAADAFRRPSRWVFQIVDPDPAAVDGQGDRNVLVTVTVPEGDTRTEAMVAGYFTAAQRQAVSAADVEIAEARRVADANAAAGPGDPVVLHATQAAVSTAMTATADQGAGTKSYMVRLPGDPAGENTVLSGLVANATATVFIDAMLGQMDSVVASLSSLAQASGVVGDAEEAP